MNNYVIRRMTRPELDIALAWAKLEGWRPGLYDAEHFYSTDPNGFFIGLLDDEPIGCISGVKYGDDFGFIGFYIVKPEWRNRGFGLQLWQTAMNYLQGRNIGLDGVIEQQHNYQKSGFHIACRHVRYQGAYNNEKTASVADIVEIDAVPFEQLLHYDSRYFPAPRAGFLQSWIKQKQGAALALAVENNISGYGVIRACDGGFRIGPLFANSYHDAEQLLGALLNHIPQNSDFFIDIPEPNQDALKLVSGYGMKAVFETARMYTQNNPAIDLNGLFAVTSLELG
ncbi:MAG: GNAT family N-acetyltransferase [Methylobacter sp.]|nr:MAG: GNAT family N-acetyltransferase [Methylobacter sp.]